MRQRVSTYGQYVTSTRIRRILRFVLKRIACWGKSCAYRLSREQDPAWPPKYNKRDMQEKAFVWIPTWPAQLQNHALQSRSSKRYRIGVSHPYHNTILSCITLSDSWSFQSGDFIKIASCSMNDTGFYLWQCVNPEEGTLAILLPTIDNIWKNTLGSRIPQWRI